MTISVRRLVATGALLLVGAAATARAQGNRDGGEHPVCIHRGRHEASAGPIPHLTDPRTAQCVHDPGRAQGVVLMTRTHRLNDCEPAPSLTFHRYGDR